MKKANEALIAMRKQRGLSQQQLAELVGTTNQQIGRLENGTRKLTLEWIERICKAIGASMPDFVSDVQIDRKQTKTHDKARITQIMEVDGHAGAGLAIGALSTEMAYDGDGNTSEVDGTRGLWDFPAEYISQLHVTPKTTRIIEVKGDSMEPTLRSGDRIMIDQDDRCPTPPGIFALWDGFGVVVKRIEHIDGSEPPRLIVSSENQRHSTYERTADEVNIIGRVVWVGRKM